ncbi:hypothetical protein DLM45_00395 [Hyphomicrobium methylovorum]|uniref:hypothetical protein n=1 Tax=Hyphomicrobium methylovorum TaxID=84 RepID=UPI0015E6D921|nr:hypothetical protein [Hyphomicrobium methylovorum]
MKILRFIDWRLLVIFALVAGIVHITATFMALNDQRSSSYTRLAGSLPHNLMTLTDAVSPGHEILPFLAPDARYAFCPFETTDATVRVHALLPDIGWTLGVYAPDGSNLYFAAASSQRESTINLSIVPADDRFLGLPSQGAQSVTADQTIAAPKGLIVVRAPDRGEPYRAETQAVLEKASCVSNRA